MLMFVLWKAGELSVPQIQRVDVVTSPSARATPLSLTNRQVDGPPNRVIFSVRPCNLPGIDTVRANDCGSCRVQPLPDFGDPFAMLRLHHHRAQAGDRVLASLLPRANGKISGRKRSERQIQVAAPGLVEDGLGERGRLGQRLAPRRPEHNVKGRWSNGHDEG